MTRVVLEPPATGLQPDGSLAGGWWHDDVEPGRIVCDLCPRACALRSGDRGFCFVRQNRDGEMVLTTYGRSTGFCIDPIEKKPLNHFYPGTSVLSFGTAGCNLGCKFCQNWSISKSREIEQLSEQASPEAIAQAARQLGCRSVAFTYNDPVVWAEYAIDAAKACRAAGVKTVAVTAGYITPAARGPFYAVMDAANVDLKGFTEDFYRHLTLSHLEPVLDTLRWLKHETDVWFEITNLVIPRANDSQDEIRRMCEWILENVGPDVPLHFTAFHPDFRLTDRPGTPPETLLAAYDIARSLGLNYVYIGNVHAAREQSTYCPGCRRLLIERDWYQLGVYDLAGDRCQHCGTRIAGRFDAAPGDWGPKRLPVRIANYAAGAGGAKTSPARTNLTPELTQISMSTAPPPSAARGAIEQPELSTEQEQAILRTAAQIVAAATAGRRVPYDQLDLAGAAGRTVMGVFVSLKRAGKLRSCCGSLGEAVTVAHALTHAAQRSANDDQRFPPVSPTELPFLDIEVWLLFGSQPVAVPGEARREAVAVGRHGLQIARGEQRGLLLPCVAIDHGLDAEGFLQHVCMKAGLPPTAWKHDDAQLSTFEGRSMAGRLGDFLDGHSASYVPPLAASEVAALAEFCRGNIAAMLTGATPSFYAQGVSDGNVQGLVLSLRGADGAEWLSTSRIALRQMMPLQATLYSLSQEIAQALSTSAVRNRLAEAHAAVAVLYDPAMHGTAADPDLRGLAENERAVMVIEGHKIGVTFDRRATPDEVVGAAARHARVTMHDTAHVYSLAAVSNVERIAVSHVPRPQPGPSVRPAALAGKFYPADPAALAALVDELLAGSAVERQQWSAVMVPHAGLKFSGRIAADVLRRVEIPETVIVIGPKHTPHGVAWAVAPHVSWSIPGARIASDPELAAELVEAIEGLEPDALAHQQEHAIEVELPLLARLAPQSCVVGIAIGSGNPERCRQFAAGLARSLQNRPHRTLLVISSDMNHFATDEENRRLDEIALEALERLDPQQLYDTVTRHHISMCGVLPAMIVMQTLRLLGGLKRSRRVAYATSADVTGDRQRVVGYAGMLLR